MAKHPRGKLSQFLQFFTQLQIFSYESWPCQLAIQVYKTATAKVLP